MAEIARCGAGRPPGLATRAALGAIWVYQRWLSPLKGFRCAHAVLHGGPGCSGFAKQAIREQGLWPAVRAIRQRFRDCRAAMEVLMTAEPPERDGEDGKRTKDGWCRRNHCAGSACEAPAGCCGATGAKGGAAAGAGAEAATGTCAGLAGGVGEGIAGGCGAIAGGISCCG